MEHAVDGERIRRRKMRRLRQRRRTRREATASGIYINPEVKEVTEQVDSKSGIGHATSMGFGPYLMWTQLDWASLDLDVKWTSGPIKVDTYGH
jgi:hypothetical protein